MNYKTVFLNSEGSNHNSELEIYANHNGELYITIYDPADTMYGNFICLDKQTAIKFSKVVRREISFLKDGKEDSFG